MLQLSCVLIEQGEEDVLLPLEVEVEGAFTHPSIGADVLDTKVADPGTRDATPGSIDDPLPVTEALFSAEPRHLTGPAEDEPGCLAAAGTCRAS